MKRIKTFYVGTVMSNELRAEAVRLDRSTSWVMQLVWKIAREKLMNFDKERK